MADFKALESLVRKGKLTEEKDVLGIKVGYRTLSYDQEAEAYNRCNGNLVRIKVEQLTFAITSIDGSQVSDSDEDRITLHTLLNSMQSSQVNELYKPYVELSGRVPELTLENVKAPLVQDHQQEASMNSAITVDDFQMTP